MRVTHFNKFTLQNEVRPRLAAALAILEEDLGLKVDIGPMRFTNDTVSCKLKMLLINEEGEVFDEHRANFEVFCEDYGFTKKHLDREFQHGNKSYVICGLRPRARKYPILARGEDGKTYRFAPSYIKKLLGEDE